MTIRYHGRPFQKAMSPNWYVATYEPRRGSAPT